VSIFFFLVTLRCLTPTIVATFAEGWTLNTVELYINQGVNAICCPASIAVDGVDRSFTVSSGTVALVTVSGLALPKFRPHAS
jgi:hypothetical protein